MKKPETASQRKRRLEKEKQKRLEKKLRETEAGKLERLAKRRKLAAEKSDDKRATSRLQDAQCHAAARQIESADQHDSRLAKDAQSHAAARQIESADQHDSRLAKDAQCHAAARQIESADQHDSRLAQDARNHAQSRANLTQEEREIALQIRREAYAHRSANAKEFEKKINTFCDGVCDICRKKCYPNQVAIYRLCTPKSYLPPELAEKDKLEVCHRCNTHLKDAKKLHAPPKSYWNKLDPGPIPNEIKDLTLPEQRMLSRMIPFIKIVKYDGRFGQYGCKGQSVLFALDIFEVSEKLPCMLPRSSADTGIIVVSEILDELNITKQYTISRDRVYAALQWLITHNPLYNDVTVNHFAQLNINDIIRIVPAEQPAQQQPPPQDNAIQVQNANAPNQNVFKRISDTSRILRASWHQGRDLIFTSGHAGIQCFSMVIANIVRAAILPPNRWNKNIINQNMIAGDNLCAEIHLLTEYGGPEVFPIPESGYMELKNLDVVKDDYIMYEASLSFDYDDTWNCAGGLRDSDNDGQVFLTLQNAIRRLFEEHNAGVLIGQSKSLGLMQYDGKYYFTDSHACGEKGSPARTGQGQGCMIECDTIEELHRIAKRAFHTGRDQFDIHYIDVTLKGEFVQVENYLRQHPSMEIVPEMEHDEEMDEPQPTPSDLTELVNVQVSVMAPIDFEQPDFDDILVDGTTVNEIVRKTKDNIVNVNHELKAEEFSWFHLFPYGINGLKEVREVKISTLDYFQARILGTDKRFQRIDYLFFALSYFEYERVKATINACAKKVRGQDGAIEDVHLTTKNLRGTAAYWRSAQLDLISQIRCIGPPTWFITMSCNDLNWLDMRMALLIADGRPNVDPSSISIGEAQKLIELYPIVVSRHFMQRVNAFMKYIRSNDNVLGGAVKDHWWRIEFQKRGSPHLHMVVWIDKAPAFNTEEGIAFIDNIISCRLPPVSEDPDMHELVKRNQNHRHTHTCYKKDSNNCRFAFPRQVCPKTRIISQTSDEFIRSGGRICLLERRSEDKWINNYSPAILKLWDGNMDIQPCGTNEGIAHYIAKYIAKSEPTTLDTSISEAIKTIRSEESNIARRLFKICMRIMKERQVSACECAYRLCHLQMYGSTRNHVFLNTRKKEERYYVLKFEGNQATGTCSNIFERYEKRPRTHADYDFANMSLTEFAMLFEPHYKKKYQDDDAAANVDGDDVEEEIMGNAGRVKTIKLLDTTLMKVRKVPAVVRPVNFIMANEPEKYFFSLLLQYVPYYDESELLDVFENARDAFLAREDMLKETSKYMQTFRERDQQLEHALNQAHAFDILDRPEDFVEAELEEEIPDDGMTEEQFQSAMAAMNVKQREIYTVLTRHIRDELNGSEGRLRMFITGNAGCGKTFTFNILKNQVNRCYQNPVVKVGALTGVAARLVGGSTLHSLLKLPVQKDGFLTPHMEYLRGNYLKELRKQWEPVKYMFIDEISMVPNQMLIMINDRLKQLKNCQEPFGGLNILVFGDLMQLPPVKGNQVYEQPYHMTHTLHFWRLFTLVELTENMRQQGDRRFADLLNALRVGELKAPHFELLMSKLLKESTGEFALNRAIRIYPTRTMVDNYNRDVLEYYRTQGTEMFMIRARDELVEATRNVQDVSWDKIVSRDINKTAGEFYIIHKIILSFSYIFLL
jgi:hypothetical protein